MKRIISLVILFILITGTTAHAEVGDMGFFGGISEGRTLPKTTQQIVEAADTKTKTKSKTKNKNSEFIYKEPIFLSGIPSVFEGTLTVKSSGVVTTTENTGTFTETYTVKAGETTGTTIIDRNIVFTVNWRREGNQVILDYETKNGWTETITTDGGTFTLDPKQSKYSVSILEDHTPGVVYRKGNTNVHAVYTSGEEGAAAGAEAEAGAEEETTATTLDSASSFYGFESAWANTETHRVDATVKNEDWQMQYQIRPSVSVNKTLQYSKNEPTLISFPGNYQEVMENKSGLQYDIFVKPKQFFDMPDTGTASISKINIFEQLTAPDVSYLKGHFAEEDIKKLFSMKILEGDPKFYQPGQAITRGQYITALVKAIKLPIAETQPVKKTKVPSINIVFMDVLPDRPDYPYIMAAFKAGLAIGRDNGNFYSDSPIQRQEAIAIMVRTLGLEQLGLDPTPMTPFTDDYKVSGWAKRELYAANNIQLISGDDEGRINPTENISKAEAAALLNRLISYMRTEMEADYAEHIVNYPN